MADGGSRWFGRRRTGTQEIKHAPTHETLLSLEARIRPDFKRAVGAGVLALACLVTGVNLGGIHRPGHLRWVVVGVTIGFAVLGAIAVRSTAREINRITKSRAGFAAASALRLLCLIAGLLVVVLGTLQLLDVDLRNLLVGGAVTGVILGIAAQQSLGNFFAGLVILFTRPYVAGQYVKIRSGSLGGPFEGTITYAGLMYTIIDTKEGRVNLPNAGLLASAIGPVPEPPREPDPDSHL
jgi:small-conductance mechanosensitive channel